MAEFSDSTSSNGMSSRWVAKISYTTTAYAGYTRVHAVLSLTAQYDWNCTLNNGYSLTINGETVSGSTAKISQSSNEVKTYTLLDKTVDIQHTTNTDIIISGYINAKNVWWKDGKKYVGTYDLSKTITLYPKQTSCTAPTSVAASPNPFDYSVSVKWNGAGSGVGNAINGYLIRYRTSYDNSNWRGWADLQTISSTSSSGDYSRDMSSLVSRGDYVQFAVRTQTSNSNYDSGLAYSNVIRRKPYTACSAPTSFTASPNNFDSIVSLEWSGARGGTNNDINGYYIEYSLSSDNVSFGRWTNLQTVSTTKTTHSVSIDVSSKIARGQYVKFKIRTQGSAGSSYYSGFKVSPVIRRNPKSQCGAPTVFSVVGMSWRGEENSYVFEDKIKLSWSGASAGSNVTISGYIIRYRTSETMDFANSTSAWQTLKIVNTTTSYGTATVTLSSAIKRGTYVQFQIYTQCIDQLYNSVGVTSQIIKKNTLPMAFVSSQMFGTNEYSNGDEIEIHFSPAIDSDNIINGVNKPWGDKTYAYSTPIVAYKVYGRYSSGNGQTLSDWEYIAYIDMTSYLPPDDAINNLTVLYFNNKISYVTKGELFNLDGTYTEETSTSETALKEFYNSIKNEEYAEIMIIPLDMFCGQEQETTIKNNTEVFSVLRYDISGVSIGIDGQWRNCTIYYCKNNEWVQCYVYAGKNGEWLACGDAEPIGVG